MNRFQLSQWHLFKQHLSWWHLFILEISQLLVTWFLYVLSLAKHPLHCCCMLKWLFSAFFLPFLVKSRVLGVNSDHFLTNFLDKSPYLDQSPKKTDQLGALNLTLKIFRPKNFLATKNIYFDVKKFWFTHRNIYWPKELRTTKKFGPYDFLKYQIFHNLKFFFNLLFKHKLIRFTSIFLPQKFLT